MVVHPSLPSQGAGKCLLSLEDAATPGQQLILKVPALFLSYP